jgi:NAD(P)-dependent dehydrogenase (short-subunit alcohol dehydrogenase family)
LLVLLDKKVAVVTGAASGLGLATARLFASEGARVIVADITEAAGEEAVRDIQQTGGDALYQHCDVRSRESVDAVVATAEAEFGALHIMVANSGILGHASFRRTEEVPEADFLEVIDVNLMGVLRSFQAAIPALRRAGGGALSATSSVAGAYGVLYTAAYSASKGGINALVRALSAELAPDNIRVNAMLPGSMRTGLHASLGRADDDLGVDRPERGKQRVIRPGRDATAEAARVHLFLCSDQSAFVSGETIAVDGGFSVWNGM